MHTPTEEQPEPPSKLTFRGELVIECTRKAHELSRKLSSLEIVDAACSIHEKLKFEFTPAPPAEKKKRKIEMADEEWILSPQPASGVHADALMIYDAYPRKQGKQAALKTIVKVLKNVPMNRLLDRTNAFAEAVKSWSPNEQQFIPHPATWFNRGSYDDDPETWVRREHSNERRATFA
jgi:hypothetical protein